MKRNGGFTLIELMAVVLIAGILVSFAWASYQKYVIRTHREKAKASLAELASKIIQLRTRTANGDLEEAITPEVLLGRKLDGYKLTITPNPIAMKADFWIVATPLKQSLQAGDGGLTFTHQGVGCWHKKTDQPDSVKCEGESVAF